MTMTKNPRILWAIPLLIAVCFLSIPAQAQYGGGSNTMASAETSTYVFLSDQSTVVKTGGIAGVHETYSIEGQFQLTVDAGAGVASFDYVDAFILSPISSSPPQSLGELSDMTSLLGEVLDDTTISFTGKAADGSDVLITVTIEDDLAYLVGQTIPPPNTADFFLFSLDAVAQRKYGGGTGEPNDPYRIATAEDLMLLGESPEDYDKHFILTADIDLDPNLPGRKVFDRAVIAPDTDDAEPFFQGTAFTGVFDGNGHTISHLTITGESFLGLFGVLDREAKISNLGLEAVDVSGVGDYVGGLVGDNWYGSITTSYSTGAVSGGGGVGGLVGYNWGGSITTSYSTGTVSGNWTVGGLVGWNTGSISTSYSTGMVTGDFAVGGLVGSPKFSHSASFWDIQTSGQTTSAGGTGLTTAEMQDINTYLNAGWDFVAETANGTEDIWSICEGTNYPRLVWQIPAGDFVCPDGITIEDFVFFIEHWRDETCAPNNDYCQGTDLDFSGTVDEADLEIFIENWLESSELEN